jgi:uncharacterized membrane protein YedE/YeeE
MAQPIATDFTPYAALLGGALIGLASVLLMAFNGRIAGITGILGGLIPPISLSDAGWRLAFIVGMIASPFLLRMAGRDIPYQISGSTGLLIVSGLMVGVGVSLASGCTSGHGVCGLARFSLRSAAAVAVFMVTGVLTTLVLRHGLGG